MKANKPKLTATAAIALLAAGTLTQADLAYVNITSSKGKGDNKHPRGTRHKLIAYKRAMSKKSRRS